MFGLCRALTAQGIRCEVAASSKLQRPGGDRVKTDARDALGLARLLRLDEVVAVRVPSESQEAARDLVRAREAARADLMRAGHRALEAAVAPRDRVLGWEGVGRSRTMRGWGANISSGSGTQAAFEDAYEAVVLAAGVDQLDAKISAIAADSESRRWCADWRVCAGSRRARVRAGRGDRRVGPVHRRQHRRLPRSRSLRALLRRVPLRAVSPRPGTATSVGRCSKRRGITARPTVPPRCCAAAGRWPPRRPGLEDTPATNRSTPAGSATPEAGNARWPPTSPSRGSWPADTMRGSGPTARPMHPTNGRAGGGTGPGVALTVSRDTGSDASGRVNAPGWRRPR